MAGSITQQRAPYEAAFEDGLRTHGWPYIHVDEQKRAVFAGAKVKSFDFLVYRPQGKAWLVDVKGRKFPYEGPSGRRYWENWVTQEDLDGLAAWENVFGGDFSATFVFAYWLTRPDDPKATYPSHTFRDQRYMFLSISVQDYAAYARPRSQQWGTVFAPTAVFRRLAKPVFT